MMKNAFYFILKLISCLSYLDFILNFWSCRKNGLIRKTRLVSKFIDPQLGKQIITIHILPNTSRSKDRLWNLVNLKNITRETIFSRNHAENHALYEVKESGLRYILITLNLAYRNKLQNFRGSFNFDFLEMVSGIVSPPYFVNDSSRKIFLMLYSIN